MDNTSMPPETAPGATPKPSAVMRAMRQFLACNPFYPFSVVVLLFGAYQISKDTAFLGHDLARLGFNFGSLQFYEALLITTAVFLARRALWYDSLLLVILENLLLVVPFILINEALFLEARVADLVVGVLCGAGAALALGRFGVLRKWMPQLNLPRSVLGAGVVILLLNLALPLLYRHQLDSKTGTRVTDGPAYELFQATWLWVLPLLAALAWFIPLAKHEANNGPRSRWFPPAFFALWLAGTAVHCWSLGYVHDFSVLPRHLAPLLWMLGWIGWARLGELWPRRTEVASMLGLIVLALVTLLTATRDGLPVFRVLTCGNLLAFGAMIISRRGGRIVWHLAAGSIAALLATMPTGWMNGTTPIWLNVGAARQEWLLALAGIYALVWVSLSRRAGLAVFGAVIAAGEMGAGFQGRPECVHLAAQAGMIFFLLHSLRWDNPGNRQAGLARSLVLAGWIAHAWSWVALVGGNAGWMVACSALVACSLYAVHLKFGGIRWPWFPGAGGSVLLSGPVCSIVRELQSAPAGVLAMLASLGLFGLGTWLALTRHRWLVSARH